MNPLLLYAFLFIGYAFLSVRKQRSYPEFIAAGQSLGTFSVLCTLLATILGASATLGVAEQAARKGYSAVWWLLAAAAGLALQGLLLAPAIRASSARTLPELARQLLDRRAQWMVSLFIVLSWPGIIAAQMLAIAKLFNLGTAGMFLAAALPFAHSFFGGQASIVKTDRIQIFLFGIGFGALFLWIFGGFAGGRPVSFAELELFRDSDPPHSTALLFLTVGGAYFLGPDIASRTFLARDGKTARRALLWAAAFLSLFACLIPLTGMWAAKNFPESALNPLLQIASILPAPLEIILLLALLCALISSADTCLMNASTILAHDLLHFRTIRALRFSLIFFTLLSLFLALRAENILSLLTAAYRIYTPGIVLPLAVAILLRRARRM